MAASGHRDPHLEFSREGAIKDGKWKKSKMEKYSYMQVPKQERTIKCSQRIHLP